MEGLGCMFIIFVPLGLSGAYLGIISRAMRRCPRLASPLFGGSALVMALFGTEVALLIGLGVVQSRALLGPVFDFTHLVVFLFGVPALANLLILPPGALLSFDDQGCFLVLLCTGFSFVLIVLKHSV